MRCCRSNSLLFPAENSLVQVELNQFLAFVQLYQAVAAAFRCLSLKSRSLIPELDDVKDR